MVSYVLDALGGKCVLNKMGLFKQITYIRKGELFLKYTKELPQTNKELSQRLEKSGWIKIKEPKNFLWALLFSFPLSCFLIAIIVYITYVLEPNLFSFITSDSLEITIPINIELLIFIVILYLYMFAHEMLHAIFIPNFKKSEKTEWGMKGVFGFVFTTEPMKKSRFLIVSCMPFILLSIMTLFLFDITGYLNWYTLMLCLINAAGSCVDFLNMILVGVQVKKGSTIINNGFETYYCL